MKQLLILISAVALCSCGPSKEELAAIEKAKADSIENARIAIEQAAAEQKAQTDAKIKNAVFQFVNGQVFAANAGNKDSKGKLDSVSIASVEQHGSGFLCNYTAYIFDGTNPAQLPGKLFLDSLFNPVLDK